MSRQKLREYYGPLENFLITKTEEYRKGKLDTQAHAILLSDSVLKAAGVPSSKYNNFRKDAFTWVNKWSKNSFNTLQSKSQQYIVVDNYTQAGSFFRMAKKARYLKSGGAVHRGHVFAAVKEFGQESLEGTVDFLAGAGLSDTALRHLRGTMQKQLDNVTPAVSFDVTKNITAQALNAQAEFTILIPETAAANLSKLEEKVLKKNIEAAATDFLNKYGDEFISVKGSKSVLRAASDILDEVIIGKTKAKPYRKKTKAGPKKVRVKPLKAKKPKAAFLPRLRDKQGRFTSPAALQNIIQSQITETVKENMGTGGSLENRTGRFAESVTITNVTQSRQGTLTAFYDYMKYPYQTFERGFKQGSTRRDPRLLISRSIRDIATKLVSRKLNIRTRRV